MTLTICASRDLLQYTYISHIHVIPQLIYIDTLYIYLFVYILHRVAAPFRRGREEGGPGGVHGPVRLHVCTGPVGSREQECEELVRFVRVPSEVVPRLSVEPELACSVCEANLHQQTKRNHKS